MRSLWPTATPRNGASDAPTTFQPGALRWTMYLRDGSVTSRCGSFETTGFPVSESEPLKTQLLLPGSAIAWDWISGDEDTIDRNCGRISGWIRSSVVRIDSVSAANDLATAE